LEAQTLRTSLDFLKKFAMYQQVNDWVNGKKKLQESDAPDTDFECDLIAKFKTTHPPSYGHSFKEFFLLDPTVTYIAHGSYGAASKYAFNALTLWIRRMEHQPVCTANFPL
jgi:hypothetical protein